MHISICKGKAWSKLGIVTSAILVVWATLGEMPQDELVMAQERECAAAGAVDAITSAQRLYYFSRDEMPYYLWYVDQMGQHKTAYSVNDDGFIARMSPDGSKVLVAYAPDENNKVQIDIVDLPDIAVEHWELLDAADAAFASIDWIDNEHIGYEDVFAEELVIQDISSREVITTNWPMPTNFLTGQPYSFLFFSPDYRYVLYPIMTEAESLEAIRSFELMEVSTQTVLAKITGRPINWSLDSQRVYFFDEEGSISFLDTTGSITSIPSTELDDIELANLSGTPTSTFIMAVGQFTPGTVLSDSIMIFIDTTTGHASDICSYGRYQILERGRFNDQVGIWSGDGNSFAYLMDTFVGPQIFVFDISEYSLSIAVPFLTNPPVIVGWSQVPPG